MFRWERGWLSNFLLQDGLSTKEQSVLLGNPHSRCSQSLWSFRIHSFVYALADEPHKKLCRKDFSLKSFKLFDASSVFTVIPYYSMLGNWGLVAVLGWSWTWAVRTGGNKVWNSVWLRSHFWEAVWGGDLRMSDFGVQCFQEKCRESTKQGRGRSWVGCGLSRSLAFADPRGSPYWTTEWQRGQFLNLFVSLWLQAVGGREDSCEPSTANTLFLICWGTSVLFSMVTMLIYIPSNHAWGFPVLCIPANACCLRSFW